MTNLTKTTYLTYSQCPKAFWLAEYQPHLTAPPDPIIQRRLRVGQEVDKLAREQFPHGRLIPYRPQPTDMASLTAQAIAEGAETLFQATFAVADLLVKGDILSRTGTGWHLIEVKSSTGYKTDEHLPDIAFQVYVLQQAGLNITQASLMHLNSDCRHPELSNLFALTDVTDDVFAFLPQVTDDAAIMRQLVYQVDVPVMNIGRHCRRPYECPFHDHCWQEVEGSTIYEIPYLKRPQEQQLEAEGIRYVADIPPGFALGDKRAATFVTWVNEQQISINTTAIRDALATLVYPLYFFDFETIDYAIPTFVGCKPYQQLPFQYSCHVLAADGTLTHGDYLHTTADDLRRALAESLLTHVGPTGHLVAYNIPFERSVLHHLADQFPDYADRLRDMANRLWDQLTIFRQHYHHYGLARSNSLKAVLPLVAPSLSYEMLAVQNGAQAQVVWEAMIGEGDTVIKNQLADHLRTYCHLDTLAMVEIHFLLVNL